MMITQSTNETKDQTLSDTDQRRIAAFVAAGFSAEQAAEMVSDASALMEEKGLVHESVMVELVSAWHLSSFEPEDLSAMISSQETATVASGF